MLVVVSYDPLYFRVVCCNLSIFVSNFVNLVLLSLFLSLLFNMLSRFIIAFLPRSKHLSISWLQSPSAVILEPKKIKSLTLHNVSIVFPSICHEEMEPDALYLSNIGCEILHSSKFCAIYFFPSKLCVPERQGSGHISLHHPRARHLVIP